MKKLFLLLVVGATSVALAGSCEYSFSWLKNNPTTNIQVPLLFEEGVGGFSYAGFADAAGGTDLRVYDTDGTTALPYEIENWDPSGKSVVWVMVPSLSSATRLHLSWGDAQAPVCAGTVWPNVEFLMHFASGTGIRKDSSANPIDFTTTADSGTPVSAEAPNGSGATFGTVAERLHTSKCPANKLGGLTADFTCSFWYRLPTASTSGTGYLFVFIPGSGNQFAFLCGNTVGKISIYNGGVKAYVDADLTNGKTDLPVASDMLWHQYVYAYDSQNGVLHGYVDGHEVLTKSLTLSFHSEKTASGYDVKVGGATSGSFVSGSMDEIRLDSVYHDADWVRAQCETQSQALPDRKQVVYAFPAYTESETLVDFPAYVRLDGRETGCSRSVLSGLVNRTIKISDENGNEVDYAFESSCLHDDLSAALWVRMPAFTAGSKITFGDTARPYYVPTQPVVADTASTFDGTTVFGDAFYHLWHLGWGDGCSRSDGGRMGIDLWAMDKSPKVSSSFLCPPTDGPRGPWTSISQFENVACKRAGISLSEPLTNVYTISWWMRKDDQATATGQAYLFCYTGTDSPSTGNQSTIYCNGNNLILFGGSQTSGSLLTVPDAAWHHYAVVNDGTEAKVYLDGNYAATAPNFDFMCTKPSSYTGYKLSVACAPSGNNPLIGAMSEFRVETVARSAAWLKACVATQKVFKDGVKRTAAPAFAPKAFASSTTSSITCTAKLSCQLPARVILCYGSEDRGEELASWTDRKELGSCDEGEISGTIESLAADGARMMRFYAVNAYGTAWSELIQARTKPELVEGRGKCIPVTVTYDGAETLTDFPVAIRIPSANRLPVTPNAIRIEDESGDVLPFEVETWDPSGESLVWVRLPSVSGGEKLSVRWGRLSDAAAVWTPSAVWGDDFLRVYHFAGAGDSSRFGADITRNDIATTNGTGAVGRAYHYAGTATSGQAVQTGDAPVPGYCDFQNGFTISFWAKIDDSLSGTMCYLFANQFDASSSDRMLEIIYNYTDKNDTIAFRTPSNAANANFANDSSSYFDLYSRVARPDDGWHLYAWTHDGARLVAYRDGVQVSDSVLRGVLGGKFPGRTAIWTRFGCTQSNNPAFKGAFDEYRVEKKPRSAAWLKACYDNQSGGLVTVGATESAGLLLLVR